MHYVFGKKLAPGPIRRSTAFASISLPLPPLSLSLSLSFISHVSSASF